MIKAIIFDADGVLCSMCESHYIALNKALKEVCGFVIDYDEHIKEFNGLPTKKKLEKLTEMRRVKREDHQIIFNRKQENTKLAILESLRPDHDKIRLHEYIKNVGLKSACFSNSIKDTLELMLSVTNQFGYLDFVVSNEDVKEAKPSPEGYLIAMEKLGMKPEECLIVEDSPVGLAAAKASGGHIWAVTGVEDVNLEGFLDRMKRFFKTDK